MESLPASDTRVYLFHSPDADVDPGAAMDKVNNWLAKDRSNAAYPNLKIASINVVPDGKGGVYTTVVCALGRATGA